MSDYKDKVGKINRPLSNSEMRELSGNIKGGKVSAFIYLLARDYLPVGVIEDIIMQCENKENHEFTNGFIAKYSNLCQERLEQKY